MAAVCPPPRTVREILAQESSQVLVWALTQSEFKRWGTLIRQLFPSRVEDLEVGIMDLVPVRNVVRDFMTRWRSIDADTKPFEITEIYAFIDALFECRGVIAMGVWMQLKGTIPASDLLQIPYGNWAYVAYVLDRFIGLMVPLQ